MLFQYTVENSQIRINLGWLAGSAPWEAQISFENIQACVLALYMEGVSLPQVLLVSYLLRYLEWLEKTLANNNIHFYLELLLPRNGI